MTDLTELITPLLDEYADRMQVTVPQDRQLQKRMLRSLVNVRQPAYEGTIDEHWLRLQDAYLQEELQAKGVVDTAALPTLQQMFGIAPRPVPEQEKPGGAFQLCHSDRMALWQGDITRLQVDAIVNAANSKLLGCFIPCHGCIDNAIHSAAGVQLRKACWELMQEQGRDEPNGFAKLTPGFNLPARYVLHTVGPQVTGCVTQQDEAELESCYTSCLALAQEQGLRSVAFCCISTGVFHFPAKRAAQIAVETVDQFLDTADCLERVIFNVYSDSDLHIYKHLFKKYR